MKQHETHTPLSSSVIFQGYLSHIFERKIDPVTVLSPCLPWYLEADINPIPEMQQELRNLTHLYNRQLLSLAYLGVDFTQSATLSFRSGTRYVCHRQTIRHANGTGSGCIDIETTEPSVRTFHQEEMLHGVDTLLRDFALNADRLDPFLHYASYFAVDATAVIDRVLTRAAIEMGTFEQWRRLSNDTRAQDSKRPMKIDSINKHSRMKVYTLADISLLGTRLNQRFLDPDITRDIVRGGILALKDRIYNSGYFFYKDGTTIPKGTSAMELVSLAHGPLHWAFTLKLLELGDEIEDKEYNIAEQAIELGKHVLTNHERDGRGEELVRHFTPLPPDWDPDIELSHTISPDLRQTFARQRARQIPVTLTFGHFLRESDINRPHGYKPRFSFIK